MPVLLEQNLNVLKQLSEQPQTFWVHCTSPDLLRLSKILRYIFTSLGTVEISLPILTPQAKGYVKRDGVLLVPHFEGERPQQSSNCQRERDEFRDATLWRAHSECITGDYPMFMKTEPGHFSRNRAGQPRCHPHKAAINEGEPLLTLSLLVNSMCAS